MSQPLPNPFELPESGAPVRPAAKWAVVGPDGSHGSRALRRLLGLGERQDLADRDVRFVPSLAGAVEAVVAGRAERAVVPWRNALGGAVFETVDAVLSGAVHVEDALRLPIRHVLAAPPGRPLRGVRAVASHPEALRQCRTILSRLGADAVAAASTADAARALAAGTLRADAVLCDRRAAEGAGLAILVDDASDAPGNETVFVVVARHATATIDPKTEYDPGLLVLSCRDEPGILHRCLGVVCDRGLDLSAIESRPVPGTPHAVRFVLDVRRHRGETMLRVLEALASLGVQARWLGAGRARSADGRGAEPPEAAATAGGPAAARASRGEDRDPRTVDVFDVPAVPPRSGARPAPPSDGRKRWVDPRPDGRRTVVEVAGGKVRVGDGGFVLIAGPCSVESAEQVHACAEHVARTGGAMLRGGAFKPRTSPYAFQGLGEEGLRLLAEAGRRHGLPVVTEVLAPELVELCARYADVLQVGARNMQNFPLLAALGATDRPVLLKRGMSASLDELLYAAEYVLSRGNHRVILCERGIRTFETATRFTLDLSAVVVLRERTHLPILVDPSHAAGARRFVPPLARAAKAVGADGILVEIHPDPDHALSDGPQALSFEAWADLARALG